MSHLPYRLTTRLALRLPLPRGKLADSLRGRHHATERWLQWASTQRTNGPLVWVHGASVGEGLTAQPVVARVRSAVPGLQTVHTFSSPSAESWPLGFGADQSDYVPPDEPTHVARVLRALDPSLLVFSRGDLWPELVTQATAADVPVAVIGGSVRPSSLRLRWPMQSMFRTLYATVSWFGAVSPADADRLVRLGARPESVTVTGDPRLDQILERVPQLVAITGILNWSHGRTVLVAGSTDERDETVLIQAFSQVSQSHAAAGLVLIPHDPTPARIGRIVRLATRHGVETEVWDDNALTSQAPCVVVARIGILFDLYLVADLAYVGGGFRKRHLHAVAEPAAYALPTLFGPHVQNSFDAKTILACGGAISLPSELSQKVCSDVWTRWIELPDNRTQVGLKARTALKQGAARKTAQQLCGFLAGGEGT